MSIPQDTFRPISPCGYCGKPLRETDLPGVCRPCSKKPFCDSCGDLGANVAIDGIKNPRRLCPDCVPDAGTESERECHMMRDAHLPTTSHAFVPPNATEATLQAYSDDYDCFVATDAANLKALVMAHHGISERDFAMSDYRPLGAADKLTIWCDADGRISEIGKGTKVTKTVAEWIAEYGRGMLCSSEY